MEDIRAFLAARLDEDEHHATQMERIARSGEWTGIDPMEIATAVRRNVYNGRHALQLHAAGKVPDLYVQLLAAAYGRHKDYSWRWRPELGLRTLDRPPCSHQRFTKERILGADTGDKVCADCDEVFEVWELQRMGRWPRRQALVAPQNESTSS